MIPRRITADETKTHEAVHALLFTAFAYMEGRIDPPSSLYRLTVVDIAQHASQHEVWVLEDSGKVVACIFLRHDPDALYLGKIATMASYRGKGYATRLIQLAEHRAHALFYDRLELQTRIELTENHQTFAKMGFTKTVEGQHPDFARTTEITLQKRL